MALILSEFRLTYVSLYNRSLTTSDISERQFISGKFKFISTFNSTFSLDFLHLIFLLIDFHLINFFVKVLLHIHTYSHTHMKGDVYGN